jgi:hypothetical protein
VSSKELLRVRFRPEVDDVGVDCLQEAEIGFSWMLMSNDCLMAPEDVEVRSIEL